MHLSRSLRSIVILSGVLALAACASNDDESSTESLAGANANGGGPASASAQTAGGGAAQGPTDAARAARTAAQSTSPVMTRPSWARPEALVGRAPADEKLSMQVHFRLRNEKDAERELADIGDPHSPRFGKFLTDEEFETKYGASEADVAAVRAFAEAHGLTVTDVPSNRTFVAVEGTADNVERAFQTKLGHYRVGVGAGAGDETRRAPITDPIVPAHLASRVLTVAGISTPATMKPRSIKSHTFGTGALVRGAAHLSPAGTGNDPADSCSTYYKSATDTVDPTYPGQATLYYAPCGYVGSQLRHAYGFDTTIKNRRTTGTGQTVGIVDAYLPPTLLADAQAAATALDPTYPLAANQLTISHPGTAVPAYDAGWAGESALGVQAVHAMAPGAKIAYVAAQSPADQDLGAAVNLIVANHLATIVSNSYGLFELETLSFVYWHSLATQAGLKGVGLYFSTGDDGDGIAINELDGLPSAGFPASLDNVTAVGGTSLLLDATNARAVEVGWETGIGTTDGAGGWNAPFFYAGSGGGASWIYDMPSYQRGVVPASMANIAGDLARTTPDVSMLGDPTTGFVVGLTDPNAGFGYMVIGGTSLSSPLFAGVMALTQAVQHHTFGFANAALYRSYTRHVTVDIKPPVTPIALALGGGYVTVLDDGAEFGALQADGTGFDTITGLGVPNGDTFAATMR